MVFGDPVELGGEVIVVVETRKGDRVCELATGGPHVDVANGLIPQVLD